MNNSSKRHSQFLSLIFILNNKKELKNIVFNLNKKMNFMNFIYFRVKFCVESS